MAYPYCDVTKSKIMSRLRINQDGEQFADLNENISRSKTNIKVL